MRTKWAVFLLFCAYVLALAALTSPARAGEEGLSLTALMYHHISPDPARTGDYVITPQALEEDLAYLREHGYEAVSAAQLMAWEAGEAALPEKPVLLTFDDGQRSFLLYALPLLEKYDMRAVAAVVGSYADEYTASGDKNPDYAYMGWDDVAAAAASGRVEIASHTQAMHSLGPRRGCAIMPGEDPAEYAAALGADLDAAAAGIELATGVRPYIFAYPFGFTCEEAGAVLAARGCAVALTCAGRVNVLSREPGELLGLARFNRPGAMATEDFFASLNMY